MRRLYVTTKEIWEGQALDLLGNPLVHHVCTSKDGKDEFHERPFLHIDLFNPMVGSAYLHLDDTHILVSTCVEHSEYAEEAWHGHPEVGVLPHPLYEGKVPLKHILESAEHAPKKFRRKHMDSLLRHKHLAVHEMDTVISLAKRARKLHPLVKLDSFF